MKKLLKGTRIIFTLLMVTFAWYAPNQARATSTHGIPLPKHLLQGRCEAFQVPVDFPNVTGATMYGELCTPRGRPPETVQLLVHGSTFNHHYWDWPLNPDRYSHVRAALEAGYATFNIDRIGTGLSTKPPSDMVHMDGIVDSLHQIVTKLRSGEIGGHPFSKVVYFGSSLSTAYGWVMGDRYPEDIDAFVLTGLLHFTRPTWIDLVFQFHVDPACEDPKFANSGIDCGYITTTPGKRKLFFYHVPNTSPIVLALDELLKDVVSQVLLFESAQLVINPDPETSPSRNIVVPTLIAFGEFDNTACGSDGLICTEENVKNFEEPFYNPDAILDVYIAENTGHALPLHFSGPETADFIHDWLDDHVGN